MICQVDNNTEFIELSSTSSMLLSAQQAAQPLKKVKNDSQLLTRSCPKDFLVNTEDFIWLELSLVPEVERVFVTREDNVFNVLAVVNERDPDVRAKVYEREKCIIDAHPEDEFDFRVMVRINRDLNHILSASEKPSYCRR